MITTLERCFRSILLVLTVTGTLQAEHVWIEGETGEAKNLTPNGWYASVREQDLSGGDWLASYGSKKPVLASYQVDVPKPAKYTLWVRANPVAATLETQLGANESWQDISISKGSIDRLNIASDGKPDMRFLAWTKVGPIHLEAGKLDVQFRFSSKNGNHGAIDCFCLTEDETWQPNKTLQPGQASAWPAPKLTDENLERWSAFIRPTAEDLSWQGVRWHPHLDEAAKEAEALGRPVLLWAMNGHPCGET